MSLAEVKVFLEEALTVICATNGPRGWPHVMPLSYVLRGDDLWAWTYSRSQKTRNLERDPRATLQIEEGDSYHELRGLMIEVDVEIVRDLDVVAGVGADVFRRNARPEYVPLATEQAQKRVALRFQPRRVVSWDHSKLPPDRY